jgi:hypothetical protein
MVVITSIYVAEVENRLWPANTDSLEFDTPPGECRNVLEDTARELISLYEGKNRVEPIE